MRFTKSSRTTILEKNSITGWLLQTIGLNSLTLKTTIITITALSMSCSLGRRRKGLSDLTSTSSSMELSSSSRYISDYDFSKWNLSFYHRNKKGNLVLISGIIAGFDVPRTVNMNVKVPTQRHKHKCCMSY